MCPLRTGFRQRRRNENKFHKMASFTAASFTPAGGLQVSHASENQQIPVCSLLRSCPVIMRQDLCWNCQISYIRPSTVIADADPARIGSVYRSHLNAVSGDARRDEEPTVQAADCGKGWNKINAVNYLAESSIVWLLESLGNWATDILGGLHTVTLAPRLYIYTQVLPR